MTGKVVWITGASSGIGSALATEMAGRGARLGLTARRVDRLATLAEELRAQGATVSFSQADTSSRDETRAAVASMSADLGPIDVVVANAGVGLADSATRFSLDRFEEMIRINLLGAATAFDAVLPEMLERGSGHLVGISSLAAFRGLPQSPGYSASKAGLSTLLEGFRPELRGKGIRVTTVHPGFVSTPMIAGAKRPRPWEMTAQRAARIIADGIERGKSRLDFPWPLVTLLSLVRIMPDWLFDRLSPLADEKA